MNDVFGKKLGQYILLEQLGEGGMAKVYNAYDSRAESNVAIKVILPSKRNSGVFLQQFEQEAKALANLTHTNIVKVLNYGVQDDQPYLVMEYISGGTLRDAMNQKLPWHTAAAVLAPIARALDYVHQQQIVHRDVKPSNILLQEDFNPMLSDFGIVKMLESKDEKADSAIGSGVGTPEYMPPEQGMGKDVDFRADIYALGIIFYEMVTGKKAYTADTPMAIVIKHITDEIKPPSSIDRNIPKFVERAILRAVEKKPEDRYLSMGHFAEVLELIAQDDKTNTREVTRISMQKVTVKKPLPVALISVILLAITGLSLLTYSYFSLRTYQPEAPTIIPATAAQDPDSTPEPTALTPATRTPEPIIPTSTIPGIISTLSLMGTPLSERQMSQLGEIARWGVGGVNAVAWSPDGNEVALGTTSGIFIHNAETREMILFIDTNFDVMEMVYNPDPNVNELAVGSFDGRVVTFDGKTGEAQQEYKYQEPTSSRNEIPYHGGITALAYSPNGRNFAAGFANGVINYFSTGSSNPLMAFDDPPSIHDLAISNDGSLIYVGTGSRFVSVWNIPSRSKESQPLQFPSIITKLSISRNGQFMLAGNESGGTAYMWDLNPFNSRLVTSFANVGGLVSDFGFSGDDKHVAIGLNDGTIKIFKVPAPEDYSKSAQPIATSATNMGAPIRSLAFAKDQPVIAAGNWGGGAVLWNAENGEKIASLADGIASVNEIFFSHNGAWLATSHEDGMVRIWDVNSAQEKYPPIPGKLNRGDPFSHDDQLLTIVSSPGRNLSDQIQVLDLSSGNVTITLPDIPQKAFVRFTNDNSLLVAGLENSAQIWDVSTWELLNLNPASGSTAGCGQYHTPKNDKLLAIIANTGILFTSYSTNIQDMCGTRIQGATPMYYFPLPNQMLFVLGDGNIWLGNTHSNDISRRVFSNPYPLPNKKFLAGDQERNWYAYELNGVLYIADINNTLNTRIPWQDDYEYRVAFLPGKNLIALGSKYGSIHLVMIQ